MNSPIKILTDGTHCAPGDARTDHVAVLFPDGTMIHPTTLATPNGAKLANHQACIEHARAAIAALRQPVPDAVRELPGKWRAVSHGKVCNDAGLGIVSALAQCARELESALAQPQQAVACDDAALERALVHHAWQQDGAQWPDAYGVDEQAAARDDMRKLFAAANNTDGPSAYCRACQAVGMGNCQHFDECSGATCITCHRPLNLATPALPEVSEADVNAAADAFNASWSDQIGGDIADLLGESNWMAIVRRTLESYRASLGEVKP